jgi:hypothetical protein
MVQAAAAEGDVDEIYPSNFSILNPAQSKSQPREGTIMYHLFF